ncbi:MAG: segregation/condensation protein A [Nitrospirota bacterium]
MDATNAYSVKVPVFEGPLDLLLHLIKQNKIDIYDIPISQITGQYLEYLEIMKELNLEIASEFLVMAATLIYIKSRMLLPPDETIAPDDQEDPRAGLVQKLLEYQAFKEASGPLREREEVWTNVFSRPPLDEKELKNEEELYLFDLNIFDLLGALQKIIKKAPPEAIRITKETLTVKDKIALILERMETEQTIRFDELFAEDRTKVQIIVTFLALLELLRLKLVRGYQDRDFGTIWIMQQTDEPSVSPAEAEQAGEAYDAQESVQHEAVARSAGESAEEAVGSVPVAVHAEAPVQDSGWDGETPPEGSYAPDDRDESLPEESPPEDADGQEHAEHDDSSGGVESERPE